MEEEIIVEGTPEIEISEVSASESVAEVGPSEASA